MGNYTVYASSFALPAIEQDLVVDPARGPISSLAHEDRSASAPPLVPTQATPSASLDEINSTKRFQLRGSKNALSIAVNATEAVAHDMGNYTSEKSVGSPMEVQNLDVSDGQVELRRRGYYFPIGGGGLR